MSLFLDQGNTRRLEYVRNALLALTLLGEALIGVSFMRTHFSNAVFMYIFASAASLYAIYKTFNLLIQCDVQDQLTSVGIRQVFSLIAASLAFSLLYEFGTLIGAHCASPFSIASWSFRRLAAVFFVAYCLMLFVVVQYPQLINMRRPTRLLSKGSLMKRVDRDSVRHSAICFVIVLAADFACAVAVSSFLSLSFIPVVSFIVGLSVTVGGIIFLYVRGGLLPERLFLLVALPVGMIFILAFPAGNVGSWDDETHYRRANSLSYIANVEETASDRALSHVFYAGDGFEGEASFNRFPIDNSQKWNQADIDYAYAKLNASDIQISTTVEPGFSSDVLSINIIGYIPSALGLWLGRLFHLPFVVKYALGRVFNLLSYCLVSYFAIRIIPTKKVLLSVLALIPTSIYMAANYSYDPWVISFTFLAVSLFVRGFLSKNDEVASKSCSNSMIAFFVAFCPKAVYFPIMGIALILLWKKNALPKEGRVQVVRFAIVLAIFLVLSFILPLLFPTPGDIGDTRGTSEVNSSEQLRFVLNDPIGYFVIFLRFLVTTYLPLSSIEAGLTNYAYLGSINSVFPYVTGLFCVYLCCVAALDSDELSSRLIAFKNAAWVTVVNICALFLVCTSLYITFTAVGSETIAGVQPRYLLPLMSPFFLFIFNFHIENRMGKSHFKVVSISLAAAVLYLSLWLFLISRII